MSNDNDHNYQNLIIPLAIALSGIVTLAFCLYKRRAVQPAAAAFQGGSTEALAISAPRTFDATLGGAHPPQVGTLTPIGDGTPGTPSTPPFSTRAVPPPSTPDQLAKPTP